MLNQLFIYFSAKTVVTTIASYKSICYIISSVIFILQVNYISMLSSLQTSVLHAWFLIIFSFVQYKRTSGLHHIKCSTMIRRKLLLTLPTDTKKSCESTTPDCHKSANSNPIQEEVQVRYKNCTPCSSSSLYLQTIYAALNRAHRQRY